MKKQTTPEYRLRNWPEYNASMKARGSLTFWLDEGALSHWEEKGRTGRRGKPRTYSDHAIGLVSTLGSIYALAGCQATGLTESILELMGVELPVADHSTVSRRLGKLTIELEVEARAEARHIVVDSTGIKVYGEGEWKTRQHGVGKRRTWRKLHLAVDERSGEILSAVVSTNDVHDGQVLGELLEGIGDAQLEQVSADGAYDHRSCYEEIDRYGARAVIPPRKDAVIWHHGNEKGERHARDENLRAIRRAGRKKWKEDSGYHRRSLSETAMYRIKTVFCGRVKSRVFENQAVELFLQCRVLNRMIQHCKPDSYQVVA